MNVLEPFVAEEFEEKRRQRRKITVVTVSLSPSAGTRRYVIEDGRGFLSHYCSTELYTVWLPVIFSFSYMPCGTMDSKMATVEHPTKDMDPGITQSGLRKWFYHGSNRSPKTQAINQRIGRLDT